AIADSAIFVQTQCRPSFLYTVEVRFRAHKDRAVGDRVRRERPLLKAILTELFVLLAWRDDCSLAFFVDEVNSAVGVHWRGGILAGQALLPVLLAGLGVVAGRHAIVGNH